MKNLNVVTSLIIIAGFAQTSVASFNAITVPEKALEAIENNSESLTGKNSADLLNLNQTTNYFVTIKGILYVCTAKGCNRAP